MSKFDVGDKVQVGANPFWHVGSSKSRNFIADRAGMTAISRSTVTEVVFTASGQLLKE